MAVLEDFIASLTAPLLSILNIIITNGLGMLAAVVVILVGYLVGTALGYVISLVLEKSRVDRHLEHLHIHDALGFIKFHELISLLFKWYVVALFVAASAALIPGEGLRSMVETFANWLPTFLIAIAVFAAGLVFAEFVSRHFMMAKTSGLRMTGTAIKAGLIVVAGLIALDQMGIEVQLASNVLLIVIGGLVLAISIAVGIGLGFALKDDAKAWVKNIVKK